MNMIQNLNAAVEILSGYSEGTLPVPSFISVGPEHISFLMSDAKEVIRWAEATDTVFMSDVARDQRYTTVTFRHGERYVFVSHMAREVSSE